MSSLAPGFKKKHEPEGVVSQDSSGSSPPPMTTLSLDGIRALANCPTLPLRLSRKNTEVQRGTNGGSASHVTRPVEAAKSESNTRIMAQSGHKKYLIPVSSLRRPGITRNHNPPSSSPRPANTSIVNSQLAAGRDNKTVEAVNRDKQTQLQKLRSILAPAHAAWDSSEEDQPSKCFENTCEQLLNNFEAWIRRSGNRSPIFILNGGAGTGKSTVAQTIAERAAWIGILGASFFFASDDIERTVSKHFFPTIAFQLACYETEFAHVVGQALERDPDISQKNLEQQFSLLIAPLQALLQKGPPIIIVIDALDECKEEEAEALLTVFAQHICQFPQLQLFVTARPEKHLRRVWHEHQNRELFYLHEIEDGSIQSDIRQYIEHSLSSRRVQALFPHLQPPLQPSSDDIARLCSASGTLFVIASTAVKFILDTRAANPTRRLACLLESVSAADCSGSKHSDVMDKLYIQIIHHAVPDDSDKVDEWFDRYQIIVGTIIALQKPLPCRVLAQLLGLHPNDIMDNLLNLHSLVAPSGADVIFRIHHKSFSDFITSAERIQRALDRLFPDGSQLVSQFLIDAKLHHRRMATACFRVMYKKLKTNMANLSPEGWLTDQTHIASLQNTSFGEELTYAALHWASHFCAARELDDEVQGELWIWAYTHVMEWLEVMSILGHIDRARDMLDAVLDAISGNTQSWSSNKVVCTMISDARQFLIQNGELLKLTPMNIYRSALPFVPQNTVLYKTYYEGAKGLRVLSGIKGEWDSAALVTMSGHCGLVAHVDFSPDGSRLASAGNDFTIRLWDETTGTCLAILRSHSGPVTSVVFSADGLRLASGSNDQTICLWDAHMGVHVKTLRGHTDAIRAVAFSPDGSRLASASNDQTIRLWDGKTGVHLMTLRGHLHCINAVVFSHDGSRLASASTDKKVCLWNEKTGVCVATLDGHSDSVNAVVFSPDGKRLASASCDKTIRLWDGDTGAYITTLVEGYSPFHALTFFPDGEILVSTSAHENIISLWNGKTGVPIATLKGHTCAVNSIVLSPHWTRLASASSDATVRLWDLMKAVPLDGQLNVSSFGRKVTPTFHMQYYSRMVTALAHSPCGSSFASGSIIGTIRVWDGQTGAHTATLIGHSREVSALAFSPDGSRLASVSQDETIRLWDMKTNTSICTIEHQNHGTRALTFAPDGSRFASVLGQTIGLWDGITGTYIPTPSGSSISIVDVVIFTFTPDGSRIVSASSSGKFHVWDGKTAVYIATIDSSRPMAPIAFSPDGSAFASIHGLVERNVANNNIYLRRLSLNLRTVSLAKYFERVTSFAFLPSIPQPGPTLPIHSAVHNIDPIFANISPSNHRLRIIALGNRPDSLSYGLVYVTVPPCGEATSVPICWFPPHLPIASRELSIHPSGSSVAVGCMDGRVILLDISTMALA